MIASRYLDDVGDGSGVKNMNGTYAVAKEFLLKPSADEIFQVTRILPFLKDNGSIDSGSYGNNITLNNGIELFVRRKGADGLSNKIIWDITDGLPIKVNPDWDRLNFDTSISSYGAGSQTLSARYTFSKEASEGVILDGANGDELVCRLGIDDYSGLIEHYIRVGFSKKTV